MIVLNSFLLAFANILHIVLVIYMWVIIINALISWVNPDPFNKIVQVLNKLVQPAYNLVRKTKIPTNFNGIDISPIIILLVIQFLDMFILRLFDEIARSL